MAQVRVGDPPDLSASGDSFALMFDFPFGTEKKLESPETVITDAAQTKNF